MRVTLGRKKVAVIGGGITGLTAAFYMQRMADEHNLPLDIILIESSLRLGGKIHTLRKDGFIIERGPESFLDHSNSVRELARELDIEDQMVCNNEGKTYVAVGNNLYPIPTNFVFGGPLEVSSFITSGIISLSGKIRAAGDLVLPKTDQEDEPIGDFFRRRFGKEVVENLVEPLLAGTFAGDIDHLSLKAMFPQFSQLEKDYRSLILGMRKSKQSIENKMIGSYQTFQNGLETLIETLEKKLETKRIFKGVKVEKIEKEEEQLKLTLNNMSPIKCDAVILTTPFNATKEILNNNSLINEMPQMSYSTIATVTMAFKKDQSNIDKKDAMSFFVSRNSDYAITTCTWCNHKWNNVAPEGYDLFRAYIGRVGDEAIVELSDTAIEHTVLHDLKKSIGITGSPEFTVVSRWKESMPQYTVGHEMRMENLRIDLQEQFPNIRLVGSSYEGISVPDCVTQGKNAAKEMLDSIFL
ncbi:protoporphyrinogen oxidase [Ureibacillus manganicus]|uniref:Coproporphyrinogen III oxidase n=1 Tax=Ureibacillus manganicus DSM 26584 TaxID=1384049 RepID=A0A0A3I5B6_9BACL|nr:protoporphyrinogen oxidase [Ureibacillus manganicus]KGR79991.1 protoporphyrinogen oxidase [Ureibacillus manganicus DSM 26584]